jgi:hypothetical protein
MASDVRLEPPPEPEEPRPPNKVGECGCCRYRAVRVELVHDRYVCTLCLSTVAGGQFDTASEELKAGNFSANMILAELRRKG